MARNKSKVNPSRGPTQTTHNPNNWSQTDQKHIQQIKGALDEQIHGLV